MKKKRDKWNKEDSTKEKLNKDMESLKKKKIKQTLEKKSSWSQIKKKKLKAT
jgi:hypothetical protein